MDPLHQRILEHVGRKDYRPAKARIVAKNMKASKSVAMEIKKAVKELVHEGALEYGPGRTVRLPGAAPTVGRVVGRFHRTEKGFGFVRPDQAIAPPSTDPDAPPAKDIFVPAKRTMDAATGDLVVVQLLKKRDRDPGPRGEIREILERQTHQFVGTYFESNGASYVQVDGNLFKNAILVGDPGAKGARVDDKVVFEMVRFPSPLHEGEGVITEVLGPRGKAGVDTLLIMREFDLPEPFAEDVLEESREAALEFDESIEEGRVDLTGETVLTIDPIDARDFDDAISLEQLENGHWRLGVHIADVSHFVRPGTALDREARERATSVYLPDRVLPMLPEVISNSLASLQPNKVRYTKTAIIEFTAKGQRVATEVCAAAIKSNKRLAYEQVDEFLENPQPWRKKLGAKVFDLLSNMHSLAMILRERRFKRGSLEMSMPEVKIDLDKTGKVSGAHVVENTESHQIIEEFMLAANEAVAELLHENEFQFLRRVHLSPTPQKLKSLTEFVNELGLQVNSLQDRFALQKLLKKVEGRPEQHAVNYATLRSMQRAEYSPGQEGHYALASDFYCHFTSPIRRYPDLTVHRLIDDMLAEQKPKEHYEELVLEGHHCSDRERRAESAERELIKLKLLHYLSDRVGEKMEAIVTGVASFGLFVQGIELPAEGLIHIDSLANDHYYFDRNAHTLMGHRSGNVFRLGDCLLVEVARVDLDRRELDFRLVRHIGRKTGSAAKKRTSTRTASTQKPTRKKSASKRVSTKKKAATKKRVTSKKRSKKTARKKVSKKKAAAKKAAKNAAKKAAKKKAGKRTPKKRATKKAVKKKVRRR